MLEIQRLGLNKIYCAPAQDSQYSFKLRRATKVGFPVKRVIEVYKVLKHLPDNTSLFHVYVIGNIPMGLLNLLKQHKEWFRDSWINFQEDMNKRNYIMQIYNDLGVNFPRADLFYSFIDESSLVIAMRVTPSNQRTFPIDSFEFVRFYSNNYFTSTLFNGLPVRHGIKCHSASVLNNVDKVALQTQLAEYKKVGGAGIVYVNGYYTDNLNLNIPDNSFVEFVYDQSIVSKETFNIADLQTFDSIKDNRLKYLLFREGEPFTIRYKDDNDLYISTKGQLVTKGVFFYQHKAFAVRNVTDKDYALDAAFVNTQANALSTDAGGSLADKVITIYIRHSGTTKPLIYSSLKLHELYKLPKTTQLNVLNNTGYTIDEFRAENLENSDYFKLASGKISDITPELATKAVGYSGVKHYYGYTPRPIVHSLIEVPRLYWEKSYCYEYDRFGKLIGAVETIGPTFQTSSPDVYHVEFIKGVTPNFYDKLYGNKDDINLNQGAEYVLLSAVFDGVNRLTKWVDVTTKYSPVGGNVTLDEYDGSKVKVVYLNQPLTYTLELPLVDGTLYFPITAEEDRGNGVMKHIVDINYSSAEVFLNGVKLAYRIGFHMEYPYISICDKMNIDHSKPTQTVHIRLLGYTSDVDKINADELSGFVHHGALTRNGYYDIRDDRVFSAYINGRLRDRSTLHYSESDGTVRTNNEFNGLPYSISERLVSVKEICGQPTLSIYGKDRELNSRISGLFNHVFKEPVVPVFNVIGDHYYLFSPLVCKIIHDLIDGNIPTSVYATPYNDTTILQLIERDYKRLHKLDPIRHSMPDNVVEIHPTSGNTTITLNLLQYRFLGNVIRLITSNKPDKINLSGYVTITNESVVDVTGSNNLGGITVV